MLVVYCCDPMALRQPDEAYKSEASVANTLGLEYLLIDHDALTIQHNVETAIRQVKTRASETLSLYRGWMMSPTDYTLLYQGLEQRGVRLINDPESYKHCHFLPEAYSLIEPLTAKSIWIKMDSQFSLDSVMEKLKPFGSRPVILKDYVKSQKHYWNEACFIPSASNRAEVGRVVNRFLELQGDSLNEGLVFREFIEFEPLTQHSKSRMPLSKEYRLFFLDGKPIYWFNYWEEGDYVQETPPLDDFLAVAQKIKSRFFTMDIAKQVNGEWLIVELGDGQVAGIPDNLNPVDFYRSLIAHWPVV